MKRMICVLALALAFTSTWSQLNEKDTTVTTVAARNTTAAFQANVFPDYINLQWLKGPDNYTGYFELYRSADGVAYNIIRQFQPRTFEGDDRYFNFKDEDPLRGKNYYRVVGYDKFTQEKRTVELMVEYKNQPRRIQPTLVTQGNQLNISNYDGQEMELLVFTSTGAPVFKRIISSSVIPLPSIAKGLYVYQLTDRRQFVLSTGKFVLQ